MHLSRQMIRIAMWLDSPLSYCEIAVRLHMTETTCATQRKRLFARLGAHTRIEAITAWEALGK